MGGEGVGVGQFPVEQCGQQPKRQFSPAQLEAIDRRAREILEEQRLRAAKILSENRTLVETLRDLLLDQKVIDAKALGSLVGGEATA